MRRSFLRPAEVAIVFFIFVACSAIPSAAAILQSDPTSGCVGGPALNGWYGILISGSTNSGSGEYYSGAVNFNGACGLSGTNVNGGVGTAVANTSVTGTYGQNSDGTYDLTLNLANQTSPLTFTIGVSSSGTKAVGIESDNTSSATIDIESQLTTLTGGYNTASLTGTYSVSCSGSGVDLNYVSFDGNGNINGVDPYDNGGNQGNSPFSGTYSVNSDGTFSGSLTGSYSPYSFTGVIDNGVTEIQYTYNQSGNGEVVGCSGRQAPTATLIGYYGMVIGGRATNGLGGQEELSGSAYFDGSGSLTVTNLQGGINTQYGNTTATGTYTTNSDNTVTLSMTLAGQTTPQTFIVGVSEGGNEAVGIETDGLAQANIDLQSQLVSSGNTYTTASLNGTYAATCSGAEVDLNYVTFDGQGNQTGVDPYNNGSYGDNPYTGTYTVNSDGTFNGGFSGAYANYQMTGVIDNATAEIEYTYNYMGSGSVVSCVGNSTYGPVGGNPVAVAPTFNPPPGAYNGNQTVAISDATPNATIYYTTNGVTPTTSSLVYGNAITVAPGTTIEAIAVAANYNNSPIAAATYFYSATLSTAATPGFNPLPGTYNSPQTVTISDTTPGAVIHCTTDGTPVSATSPVCSTVAVSATTTIQAIAVATGYNNSLVATGLYTITPTVATPAFNPAPGTYYSPEAVTLSDTTPGAVIHCTTNGSTPNALSPVCKTINVTATTTIEAFAIAYGYNNSAVTTGVFTITATPIVPYIQVNNGAWQQTANVSVSSGSTVNLGPQPATGGSWLWSGPNGYTSTSRQINSIPLSTGANLYVATYTNPSGFKTTQVFTITVSGTATAINLSNYFNVDGIATAGTDPINHGFDNGGFAYNSALLGTSLTYQGQAFPLAAANTADALSAQTVAVSAGSYGQLYLVGAGVNGAQLKQSIVVTYTDRSTSTFTQNFSDWAVPASYPGEATVLKTANRITEFGTTQTGAFFVYGYTFALTPGKTVASVKLPSNRNVVFLGMGLGNTNTPATQIVPYIQVSNGAWQQTASAAVTLGSAVNLGPQPLTGGTWSWTGPNGYISTSRQINTIPLTSGTNVFTASYTNPSGVQTTETFTLTGNFAKVGVLKVTPSCEHKVGVQSCTPQDLPTSIREIIRIER